ncbi:MAG: hypothetical protein ACR2GQ_06505 [Gemmatimonadota bacterium]
MRSIPAVLALVLGALSVGCSSGSEADPPATTEMETERARDSAIAESALPGARGVRGAMGAADSAAARNARIDSMAP